MYLLTLLHRWLGIFFCLLFAMWFASGIVMHFVPFPALTEAERLEGLAPMDAPRVLRSVADAIRASAISDVTRVRLIERVDGPVYIIAGRSGLAALRANDLSPAKVDSEHLAVSIAADHAHRRHIDATKARFAELAAYDQWTVPNDLDRHRPLYRVSLNDQAQTEVYLSSATGEVVRDTTLHERWWNYAGSVAHWIYPAVLRSRPRAWEATVWTLSLIALIAAISGSLIGVLRIRVQHYRLVSPYRGWQAWHHILGLACMTFVLTWIFSGWLSLDNGRLFSIGRVNVTPAAQSMDPHWDTLLIPGQGEISPQAREVEWFLYWGRLYGRERTSHVNQHLWSVERTDSSAPRREYMQSHEINAVARHLAPACDRATVVAASDNYAIDASVPGAPVYRLICGDVWFHIDGASGAIVQRLDQSGRAYRWLFNALHLMDIPTFVSRPKLRTAVIVTLSSFGLIFSLTGVVIGWRRLSVYYRQARH